MFTNKAITNTFEVEYQRKLFCIVFMMLIFQVEKISAFILRNCLHIKGSYEKMFQLTQSFCLKIDVKQRYLSKKRFPQDFLILFLFPRIILTNVFTPFSQHNATQILLRIMLGQKNFLQPHGISWSIFLFKQQDRIRRKTLPYAMTKGNIFIIIFKEIENSKLSFVSTQHFHFKFRENGEKNPFSVSHSFFFLSTLHDFPFYSTPILFFILVSKPLLLQVIFRLFPCLLSSHFLFKLWSKF